MGNIGCSVIKPLIRKLQPVHNLFFILFCAGVGISSANDHIQGPEYASQTICPLAIYPQPSFFYFY